MPLHEITGGVVTAVFFVALVLAAGLIALLIATNLGLRIAVDVPNHRSLHVRPIPRIGGWGIVPAAVIVATLFGAADGLLICIVTVLFFVSYADDRFGLPILV